MPLNPLGDTFFPKIRKQVNLENYVPLRGRGDKNGNGGLLQKKLQISMELTSTVVGMPGWIGDAMDAIAKDDALISRIVFDNARLVMPGMTVDVFASTDSKARALLLTGCEFSRFVMSRQGLEEATRYFLDWQIQCVDPMQLHEWLDVHLHRGFCIACEQGQKIINFETGEERGAEDKPKKPKNEDQQSMAYPDGDPDDPDNHKTMAPSRDAEFATAGSTKSAPSTATAAKNATTSKKPARLQ